MLSALRAQRLQIILSKVSGMIRSESIRQSLNSCTTCTLKAVMGLCFSFAFQTSTINTTQNQNSFNFSHFLAECNGCYCIRLESRTCVKWNYWKSQSVAEKSVNRSSTSTFCWINYSSTTAMHRRDAYSLDIP